MMNAAELAEHLADAYPKLTKAQAKELVETVFEEMRAAALKGEEVSLPDFGKFKVQDNPARVGRNPRMKEAVQIAASRKVVFEPAKALKEPRRQGFFRSGLEALLIDAFGNALLERQATERKALELRELEEAAERKAEEALHEAINTERQGHAAGSAGHLQSLLGRVKADVPSVVVVAIVFVAVTSLVGYGSVVGSAVRVRLSPAMLHVTAFIPIALILLLGLAGSWLFWLDSKPRQ